MTLLQLSKLAEEQLTAEKDVGAAERAFKNSKERLRDISENQIPELMDALGIEEFTTTGGLMIKVSETLRASIPKDHLVAALAWLRDNGHEKLIKHEMTVQPDTDEDADILANIFKDNRTLFTDKSSVNHMTLGKFCREKLEAGENVPDDLFGIFRHRRSKVEVT